MNETCVNVINLLSHDPFDITKMTYGNKAIDLHLINLQNLYMIANKMS